jgi:hypothetical protein
MLESKLEPSRKLIFFKIMYIVDITCINQVSFAT